MKISLKNYTFRYLTFWLLIVIAIWAFLFHSLILDEVYDNVDDGLKNQKIEIISDFSPFEVLKKVKDIENNMGRTYTQPLINEKYVDRIIDIDILYFNSIIIDSNRLKVPHPQNYSREFIKSLFFY